MSTILVQLFLTIVPCAIVGLIAYQFFKNYLKDQERRRFYLLKRETKKEILPYRVQALERLVLFMERIDPKQLLIRVKPVGEGKIEYVQLLVGVIEQEYQHNVAQQIYVSDKCWMALKTSKNATINLIHKTSDLEDITTAAQLREQILIRLEKQESPSNVGIQFLKREAMEMW